MLGKFFSPLVLSEQSAGSQEFVQGLNLSNKPDFTRNFEESFVYCLSLTHD